MANRLARQTSPYLQQHADNPVDWYPWGEEALALARASGKPILLSIGYSACHWCHVMAHESFEDPVTARLMNELFVNVKVDREERPDLDRIYQIAHQMLTQRGGGWPLTMFLAHDDQRPFFGGTYFPPTARFGMPAFRDLLARVAEYYREHREDLRSQNTALDAAFAELAPPPAEPGTVLNDAPLRAARQDLEANFDRTLGGFGSAPKFPHPTMLERLLRDWRATAGSVQPDLQALFMATLTLKRMADGGVYDQLGGGFCRYSVDACWMIPHFEKMLYDNGALLATYAQAAVATGDGFFARIAGQTADWVIRDMQSPEGGYYSSLDADSEGHEGRFYVWQAGEVRALLGADEFALFAPVFGLDRAPNFEGTAWHLHRFKSVEEIAADRGPRSRGSAAYRIDAARAKLLEVRRRRAWPGRDEKILTSWNAIMIRGMAQAARALRRPDLAASATRALDFLRRTLWRNGRLLATYKDGRAHLNAYLDDYALLADAILELLPGPLAQRGPRVRARLLEVVLEHFEDRDAGGFCFTADDHEAADASRSELRRRRHAVRQWRRRVRAATPGVPARRAALAGRRRARAARRLERPLERQPQAHASMLTALEETLHPPETIVLRGDAAELARWQRDLDALYAPRRMLLAIPSDAAPLPAALAAKAPLAAAPGKPVAYLCRGSTCSAPIESLQELARDLRLELEPQVRGAPGEAGRA